MKIIHASNLKEAVDKSIETLGLKKGGSLEIVTPQFERTDGLKIKYIPKGVEEFDYLKTLPDETLRVMGVQLWSKANRVWLYPKEWYDSIPDGYEIITINGVVKRFEPGKTNNDPRFGALSYGFKKEKA